MDSTGSFSLIIQGPLISRGKMGDNSGLTSFDCTENILGIASRNGHLFKEIIFSSWMSEQTVTRAKQLEEAGIKCVLSPDEGFDYRDNRLRQWGTTLAGLEEATARYCIKLRSDQNLDLSKFVSEFLDIQERYQDYLTIGQGSTLHGLFLFQDKPAAISDFSFVAERQVLLDFVRSQFEFRDLQFFEDADWPEGDALSKYLLSIRKKLPERTRDFYLPVVPRPITTFRNKATGIKFLFPEKSFRVYETALRAVISVSTPEVTNSLTWRGKKFLSTKHLWFYEDWLRARIDYGASRDFFGYQIFDSSPSVLTRMLGSRTFHRPTIWALRSLLSFGVVLRLLGRNWRTPRVIGNFLFFNPHRSRGTGE